MFFPTCKIEIVLCFKMSGLYNSVRCKYTKLYIVPSYILHADVTDFNM